MIFFPVRRSAFHKCCVLVVTHTFHDHFIVVHTQLEEEKQFAFILLYLTCAPAFVHVHQVGSLSSMSHHSDGRVGVVELGLPLISSTWPCVITRSHSEVVGGKHAKCYRGTS